MTAADPAAAPERRRAARWKQLLPWAITLACFAFLWQRLQTASGPETGVLPYLGEIFASVDWVAWLALMVPYSLFFMAVDTAVLWRVVGWFNTRVTYRDLFPVRASAYIISIVNEQVGKGAIAYYLHRREGVPGWQVGSSLVFIMFCEYYYLLTFALVGSVIGWNDPRPEMRAVFHVIPWIWGVSALFLAGFIAFFRSERFAGWPLRDRAFLHAFRRADLRHYLGVLLIRSPAMIGAVFVYSLAASLFGVSIGFGTMASYLPVIFFAALVPVQFRVAAVAMWSLLVPEKAGAMTAFGFVMHNFFVLFNAAFGVLFLRRANRELFGPGREAEPAPERT